MKRFHAAVGPYGTNCWLLTDPESGEAAAVDCALYDEAYRRMLRDAGVTRLKYILLTHGHFDHVCGVAPLRDACGGEVCISAGDAACLTDENESLNAVQRFAVQAPCAPDRILREGDALSLGGETVRVLDTPGHTRGSLCFLTADALFSGDTLFRLSMGRTDLPGGSTRQLFASLRRLGALEGDYDVCPGHGEPTTLAFEKRYNRYLRSDLYLRP